MESSDGQRKLTEILCADVVGYSRLMGDDEPATVQILTEFREVFISYVQRHHGRVVGTPRAIPSWPSSAGICISRGASDQVRNKLPLEYDYQGEKKVKNIAEPIHVYRVLAKPGSVAHRVVRAKAALPRSWLKWALVAGAVVVLIGATSAAWYFLIIQSFNLTQEVILWEKLLKITRLS